MGHPRFLFFILIIAVCATQFAADVYAPCLPAIAHSFQTSLDDAQFSMSIYMLGVALSQLVYGPLSERWGRKRPMCIGFLIMMGGSLLCVFAPHIEWLIWGRFIQGCGAGACASLWRSIFRDVFTKEELVKYSSYLVIFITFIVPSAPLVGSYLQIYFGWRSTFYFIAVSAFLAFFAISWKFQETNKYLNTTTLTVNRILANYAVLLKSPPFVGMIFVSFLIYGAFFAWFVVGPALLIHHLGLSPTSFGWLNFIGSCTMYGLAGYLNGKFVNKFGIPVMLRFGLAIMGTSGAIMLVLYGWIGTTVWAVMAPVILFYFGSTFIWPNAFAIAFTPFGKIAGYAGALYGFMQVVGAAILSGIISFLPDKNPVAFGTLVIASSVLSWLIYRSVSSQNNGSVG